MRNAQFGEMSPNNKAGQLRQTARSPTKRHNMIRPPERKRSMVNGHGRRGHPQRWSQGRHLIATYGFYSNAGHREGYACNAG